MTAFRWGIGDRVQKDSGDYRFRGEVVMRGTKRSGAVRYVVENDDGMLFIFNEAQLEPWDGRVPRREDDPRTARRRGPPRL